MKNNIAHFKSKSEIALDTFISNAQSLSFFQDNHPNKIDFYSASWDLKNHIKIPDVRSNTKLRIPGNDTLHDFMKSVIAFELWENRKNKKSMARFSKLSLAGLRIIDVFEEECIPHNPINIRKDHLDKALLKSKSNRDMPGSLNIIAKYLSQSSINFDVEDYKAKFSKNRTQTSRLVNKKQREPLTDEIAFAIAEAFHKAETPRDQIVTSILALLTCAPSRLTETLILPLDVEITDAPGDTFCNPDTPFTEDIRFHYGLRWFPVKGGQPTVKFIPRQMVPVAKEAIKRLKIHTETARQTAKWMFENPKQIPLPKNLEHARQKRTFTHKEIKSLYGQSLGGTSGNRAKYRGTKKLSYDTYCLNSIENHWNQNMPSGWPFANKDINLKYHEALCVVFPFTFVPNTNNDITTVEMISARAIQKDLSTPTGKGIFDRLDVKLPDGTSPKFTTHQIRHYLNTIAQQANIPQAHIAMWSGRKSVMQNNAYDHTDRDALVDKILNEKKNHEVSLPVIVDDTDPTVQKTFLKQNITSTPIGFCLGDLRFSPCDKAGACIDCTRLICIAEPGQKRENLARDVERKKQTLKNFDEAIQNGKRINIRAKTAAEKALIHGQKLLSNVDDRNNQGNIIHNRKINTLNNFSHDNRLFSTTQEPAKGIEK
jgi:hypothetical protein